MNSRNKTIKNIKQSKLTVKKNKWREWKECHDWSEYYFGSKNGLPF